MSTDNAKPNVGYLTINWKRCIHVDGVIDEELLRRLTPQILSFRQESAMPITVSINSHGGSLAIVDTLLNLLTGPDQNGNLCSIITVVIKDAFSAAANLLAAGHYAVALPHSEILFHDIRYGGIEDVTPTVAKNAASQLQQANAEFSLKLANNIFRRLVWNYLDLQKNFEQIAKEFPEIHAHYKKAIDRCGINSPATQVDIPSFATSLFAMLSSNNDDLVAKAIQRLHQWGVMMALSNAIPNYQSEDGKMPGLLEGPRYLFQAMQSGSDADVINKIWETRESDLKLYLALIMEKLFEEDSKPSTFASAIDRATEDYKLIQSINDPQHFAAASRQLLRHKHVFFESDALAQLESDDEEKREATLKDAMPAAKLLWHFCVLLCEELFSGEHKMLPNDAQILGIVDEVVGGGPIESRREFECARSKNA